MPFTPGLTTPTNGFSDPDPSCKDHGGAKFYTVGTKMKRCKWLVKYPSERPNFCSGSNGTSVTMADIVCPSTCNSCLEGCLDSDTIGFKRSSRHGEKKCQWLNDHKRGERRRKKYCSSEPGINTAADAVCPVTCSKCSFFLIDNGDAASKTDEPTSGPSQSPTIEPASVPTTPPVDYSSKWWTNPVPAFPHKGYFNYNPWDSTYGPGAWAEIPKDHVTHTAEYKYWKEFEDEIRPYIDLDRNYCSDDVSGERNIQAPITISDSAVDGECFEYHQVRDKVRKDIRANKDQ